MFVEVCRCTSAYPEPEPVHKVLGNNGVHRSEVKLTLRARCSRFHIVFKERPDSEYYPSVVFRLLHAMDELIH